MPVQITIRGVPEAVRDELAVRAALKRQSMQEFLRGELQRVVAMLPKMFTLAQTWDLVPKGRNPCRAVNHYREKSRERFLTDAEFTKLGQVLDEVSGNGSQVSAGAVTTIRLLMLTACRKSEIMTLPWKQVDLDRAEMRIVNGKTGDHTVHLPPAAVGVLVALPRQSDIDTGASTCNIFVVGCP